MGNAGLEEAQAGIKTAERNINNLRYADDTTLMAKSKEKLKSLLMKVRGDWQSWPKTQHSEKEDYAIQSHQFIDGETVETVTFFWGAPKSLQMVTAAMKLKDTYSLGEKQWPN